MLRRLLSSTAPKVAVRRPKPSLRLGFALLDSPQGAAPVEPHATQALAKQGLSLTGCFVGFASKEQIRQPPLRRAAR